MDTQKQDEIVPDGVKRAIRSDADSAERAKNGPYAREIEDYTDAAVVTPTENGAANPPRSSAPGDDPLPDRGPAQRLAPAPDGASMKETTMARETREMKTKSDQDLELSQELESTFPSSDAPSLTQPGGGITGPEVVGEDDRYARISERAYAIWMDQGQVHGSDEEHWREAEREIDAESKR